MQYLYVFSAKKILKTMQDNHAWEAFEQETVDNRSTLHHKSKEMISWCDFQLLKKVLTKVFYKDDCIKLMNSEKIVETVSMS